MANDKPKKARAILDAWQGCFNAGVLGLGAAPPEEKAVWEAVIAEWGDHPLARALKAKAGQMTSMYEEMESGKRGSAMATELLMAFAIGAEVGRAERDGDAC
ncbi:hypothetical protein LCGC14_0983450 [marine sediment metagenome]|uniref:Uncharacterized protein n=1 Tax=marine sediment metagenome TaxID=412755 RepID=A0A0F9QRA9_9ZZZZ